MKIKCETGMEVVIDASTLCNANLNGLNLHRAIFHSQVMNTASFINTDLRSAVFDRADLTDSNFTGASLMNAIFRGAVLVRANLQNSRPIAACFDNANLQDSVFEGSDVGFASFRGAILCGANMCAMRLDTSFLEGAIFDASTKWPNKFCPLSKGALKK